MKSILRPADSSFDVFWAVNCEVWAHFTEHDSNGHFICVHTAETTAYLLYTNTGTCPCQFWPFWVLFTWRRVIRRQPPFCTDLGSATVKPVIPFFSTLLQRQWLNRILLRFSIRAKCFKFYQCMEQYEQYASSALKDWMTAVCTVQQHTSVGCEQGSLRRFRQRMNSQMGHFPQRGRQKKTTKNLKQKHHSLFTLFPSRHFLTLLPNYSLL